MTPDEEVLSTAIALLKSTAIPFMLTGSVAASYHGRPRATHDADIVIDPTPAQLEALIAGLTAGGFYVDDDSARRALRERTQFNVIQMRHASKIDLIVRRDRPFSHEEFQRRVTVDLTFAHDVPVVSPEDAILSKLEWARMAGESERQLLDAAGVLELNPSIDREYVTRWARALGVSDLWGRVSDD